MVHIGDEEQVNLDNLADGLSEVRKYKSKPDKTKKKENKKERKTDKEPEDIPITPPKVKLKKSVIAFFLFSLTILLVVISYVVVLYGNIPFVVKWRNIWIETAMTTDQHKWLATSFFPQRLIDEVMSQQVDIKDISVTQLDEETVKEAVTKQEELQKELVVGEPDEFGNIVFANDKEEEVVIVEIKGSTFVGKLAIVADPSRVVLRTTDYKNSRGEFICDYLEKENGVVATNASGFYDPGGTSMGGVVTGQCVSGGEYWGNYDSKYTLVGFDDKDRLVVGGMSNWEDYNIRDGFQYRPSLIINGEKVVRDSAGWGLQPRSVIGQCADGTVLLLVIDGRRADSLGATMEDCADILLQYGAVTAGACDGGSSAVIAYDGELINDPSTNMPTGRYLPNAWVILRKDAMEE